MTITKSHTSVFKPRKLLVACLTGTWRWQSTTRARETTGKECSSWREGGFLPPQPLLEP